MIPRVTRMLIKAFRVNLKKFPQTPPLKTKIPICIMKKGLKFETLDARVFVGQKGTAIKIEGGECAREGKGGTLERASNAFMLAV